MKLQGKVLTKIVNRLAAHIAAKLAKEYEGTEIAEGDILRVSYDLKIGPIEGTKYLHLTDPDGNPSIIKID